MSKALLISVKPRHARNILNGIKTLKLRKWLPKDFVGWVYIYVSKGSKNQALYNKHFSSGSINMYGEYFLDTYGYEKPPKLNGKVVARFWLDEYDEVFATPILPDFTGFYDCILTEYVGTNLSNFELRFGLCLCNTSIESYLMNKKGYAWYIKKLEIFDTPKELSDFHTYKSD